MRIFVSYRSLDRHLVNTLVTDVADMGYEVWYDQELEGGQSWWNNILDNIQRSELVLFALTPNSVDSYPCQLEYNYANALRRHIIPVELTSGIDYTMLPVVLQERQIVKYTAGDLESYKRLSAAIRKLPDVPELPDPLPEPPPIPISPLAPIRSLIDTPTLTLEQQTALVHHLKSYIGHPEYDSGSRELLKRLSQHPALLASVLREIETVLNAPTPAQVTLPSAKPDESAASVWRSLFSSPPAPPKDKPKESKPSASVPAEEPAPAFTPDPGEHVLRELKTSFLGGSILGMAAGYFTAGVATVATAAARKALERKTIVTDKRIIFLPSANEKTTVEIRLDQIAEIKKTLKLTDPAIEIRTKSGEQVRFSIVAAAGVGFGNRDEFITLIQQNMPKTYG